MVNTKKIKSKKTKETKEISFLDVIFCLIMITCVTLFLVTFISSFFRSGSVYYKLNPVIYIPISIFCIILWKIEYKVISKVINKLDNKKKIVLHIFAFSLIVLLLVYLYFNLEVPLGWDYGVIFGQSSSYALTGSRMKLGVYPEYLQYFPNNISIFLTEVCLFKFFSIIGYNDFTSIAIIFNGILIFISVIFVWLYCRKKMGEAKGLFSVFVTACFLPLFTYLPIFYSDTMSVLYVPLLLYIYTFFEEGTLKSKKTIMFILLFSFVLFIGTKFKMTVLFLFFGIAADLLMKKNYKILSAVILSCLLTFITLGTINRIVFKDNFKYNEYGKIPFTHWIMMGIEDPKKNNNSRNSYGGYNESDYNITKSYKTGKESIPRHIKEIKRRLKDFGFIGYVDYLDKKLVNVWCDGSYFSDTALNIDGKNKKNNIEKFLSGEDKYKVLTYIEQGVHMAFIIIYIISGVYCLKYKKKECVLYHFPLLILMLFLLIWEARSRYIYNYIPLFVIIIAMYIEKITSFRRNNYENES